MGIFGILFYIPIIYTFIIINTVIEGRNVKRHHGHRPDDYVHDERLISRYSEDDLDYDNPHGQTKSTKRHGRHPEDYSSSLKYEDAEDRGSFPTYRHRHNHTLRNFETLRQINEECHLNHLERSSIKNRTRRKRHNRNNVEVVQHSTKSDDESFRRDIYYNHAIQRQIKNGSECPVLNIDAVKMFNRSICGYTVMPVPDPTGTRIPKNMKHVICNNLGEACFNTSFHACTQTYNQIEVMYANGTTENMKLYMGCICAMRYYEGIPYLADRSTIMH